ncbi:MBL fold metallo-hydrolase [Alkalicoccus daliensis]|uniref:Glyoxylase, beta-lactamase superfamily II n=1 Tax=Alkalicoccus daliensis TaxID=745820 RepID=A0A1H0B7C1_9BACI|nr:MBL fold metallo-hydrolase [Alkalicoccus daliensis]SDN41549.1 Glyoxylase, beta-lactamase superfamily II [Alkalicoccus daliensis]
MNYERMPLGALQTNSFILWKDQKAIVIDPAGEAEKLAARLEELQVEVEAILLTHAHFDHIGALEKVRKRWNCPVYLHEEEKDWLGDEKLNGSGLFPGIEKVSCSPADYHWEKEGVKQIGSFQFELLETPGHSPGSVTYYFSEEKTAFSGDVLFRGGVGRTDLPGGNHDVLLTSIHEKLLELPEETLILNGHGPETTIMAEKETNPFINGFGW